MSQARFSSSLFLVIAVVSFVIWTFHMDRTDLIVSAWGSLVIASIEDVADRYLGNAESPAQPSEDD